MTQFFRVMGRFTGQVLRSHVLDRAITTAAGYIVSEMRLTDIKLKRVFLSKKRTRHLTLLGRTVYRLLNNNIDPASDERVSTLVRVLREIDGEVEAVEQELERRKEQEQQRKKSAENREKHRHKKP